MGSNESFIQNDAIRWRFRTFGGLSTEPTQIKFRTRKTEALATYLALTPGTLYNRDTLAGIFWPDDRQDTARQSVRMAISNIRSALGEESILTDRQAVGLNPTTVNSDLAEFQDLLSQARTNAPNENAIRLQAFDIASESWLPNLDADWVAAQSHHIQEQVADNSLKLIDLLKAENKLPEAIQIAKKTIEICGCREDLHIALMQLYVDSGLTSLAIAQFESLEQQLDDLWGEPPSPAAIAVLETAPRTTREQRSAPQTAAIKGLFGREAELNQVTNALLNTTEGVLITLTGTGGTGKTSIARATAKLLEEQGKTTHFIDLTTTTTINAAFEKILGDLNITNLDLAEAQAAVGRFINASNAIFIFDNLEQLEGDAPLLIKSIQEICPNVKLLITTRTPLGVENEQLILVKPLKFPAAGASLEEIRQASAIQVFQSRARQANPDFAITPQNANSIIELCRRLDGLPLPIKLAASRVVVRTPAQILASIHSSLEPIKSTDTSFSDRHSNITSTVRWSYELLSPEAQVAALTLSLYSGSFTETTAAALLPNTDTLAILEELVKTSLLNIDTTREASEFWFYETVRTSLQAILGNDSQYQKGMSALLNYCIQNFAETESKADLPGWKRMREHFSNIENIMSALQFASEQNEFNPDAAKLAIKAQKVVAYSNSGRITPILLKFFEWPGKDVPNGLRALVGCAITHSTSNSGEVEQQYSILKKALTFAEGDRQAEIETRHCLANYYKVVGDYDQAITEMQWVLENTDPDDHLALASRYYRQGLNYGCLNDRPQTFDFFSKALPHARKSQDLNSLIRILFDLGSEYAFQKNSGKAIECFIEAETLCESVGSRKLEGLTRWQHGDALLDLNQPVEALQLLKQSIQLVYEGNFPAAEKWIFIKAAQAAAACGHPIIAVKLVAKGVSIRESENRTLAVYEQEYINRLTEKLNTELSSTDLKKYSFEGQQSEWSELWKQFNDILPKQNTL